RPRVQVGFLTAPSARSRVPSVASSPHERSEMRGAPDFASAHPGYERPYCPCKQQGKTGPLAVAVPDQRCPSAPLKAFTPVFDGLRTRVNALLASLRSRCIASGTRKPRTHSQPLFTFQTATLPRSRDAFLRPGFCLFASLTPSRGGRSAERRSGVGGHP